MPQMGESVTEGTVLEWLKQVGDRVEADEPLVEVSTDKVDAEVLAPAAGTSIKILAEPDSTVQVGAVLGEIEANGDPSDRRATSAARADEGPSGRGGRRLPEMGDSVAEGTVLEWRVAPGDTVAVDDPLVEISTDKVDAEVPSPVAGTVQEILVEADETVPVGAVLCRIAAGAGGARSHRGRPRASRRPGEGRHRAGDGRQRHAGGGADRRRARTRRPGRGGHRPARPGHRRTTCSRPSRATARRCARRRTARRCGPSAAPPRRSCAS